MFKIFEKIFYNNLLHSENDLIESTKFWLVQLQNLYIIRTKKRLVDPTKYLAGSTNLFDCFYQIEIFGRINQNIYFNQRKICLL